MELVGAYTDTKKRIWIAFRPKDVIQETPARYCACGNELTKQDRDTGETVCQECR